MLEDQLKFKCNLPLNFHDDDLKFFESFLEYNYSAPKIDYIKNIKISNNLIAYHNSGIIAKTAIRPESFLSKNNFYKFYLKYIFPQINFKNYKFILIANEYYSNYFHWHESLIKLFYLKQKNLLQDYKILLPKKAKKIKFIVESLKALSIDDQQIFYINKKSHVNTKELLILDCNYHPQLLKDFNNFMNDNFKNSTSEFGDKIYISRAKQKIRKVENEDQVMELLSRYGFKKVFMEELSYHQQVQIFCHTKYLITPHGAGITNSLFMKPNSYVLELSAKKDQDFFKNFFIINSLLNHQYLYLKCKVGKNSLVFDSHQANLEVDLEKLEKNINLMLNHE
jgi:capsular polysaccharide biosynthesis protein